MFVQSKFEALKSHRAVFTRTRNSQLSASKYGPVLFECFKPNLDEHKRDNAKVICKRQMHIFGLILYGIKHHWPTK